MTNFQTKLFPLDIPIQRITGAVVKVREAFFL